MHLAIVAWGLLIAGDNPPSVPASPAVKIVAPGTPDTTGTMPKADRVVEDQSPAVPTNAPADSKPVLSEPVPPVDPATIQPQIRYFVLVFSSESVPKKARFSHTWAVFVKATPKPDGVFAYDPAGDFTKHYDLKAGTISWLPASMQIRVIKIRPDVGRNFDLDSTMRYVRAHGERIALWGPYELNPLIAEEVYEKALKQIAKLNSGCLLYKAIDPDSGPGAGRVIDCIHAVSDLDGLSRRLQYDEFQNFGWDGGRAIVRSLTSSNRVDPTIRHDWVATALGIDRYPVSRQSITFCRPAAAPGAQ